MGGSFNWDKMRRQRVVEERGSANRRINPRSGREYFAGPATLSVSKKRSRLHKKYDALVSMTQNIADTKARGASGLLTQSQIRACVNGSNSFTHGQMMAHRAEIQKARAEKNARLAKVQMNDSAKRSVYVKIVNRGDGNSEVTIRQGTEAGEGFTRMDGKDLRSFIEQLAKMASVKEAKALRRAFLGHSETKSLDKLKENQTKTQKKMHAGEPRRIWARFVQGGAPGLGKRA